jgi:hypothetical protein
LQVLVELKECEVVQHRLLQGLKALRVRPFFVNNGRWCIDWLLPQLSAPSSLGQDLLLELSQLLAYLLGHLAKLYLGIGLLLVSLPEGRQSDLSKQQLRLSVCEPLALASTVQSARRPSPQLRSHRQPRALEAGKTGALEGQSSDQGGRLKPGDAFGKGRLHLVALSLNQFLVFLRLGLHFAHFYLAGALDETFDFRRVARREQFREEVRTLEVAGLLVTFIGRK